MSNSANQIRQAVRTDHFSQSDDRPMFDAMLPILATAAILVAVIWFGASMLGVGNAIALAASLSVSVIALLVIAVRHAGRSHADMGAAGGQGAQVHAGANHPYQPADAICAESLPAHGRRWSLEVFASIDAQRFAAVCETWFSWAGFDTRADSHRTDEGVDIWLHAAKMPGPVAIVRCKHGQDKPVQLQEMREFQGLVANCKSAHGTFTTTSTYTPEALQYAREHGIEAVDGKGLLRKILTRTRQSQQALLAVAFNGH